MLPTVTADALGDTPSRAMLSDLAAALKIPDKGGSGIVMLYRLILWPETASSVSADGYVATRQFYLTGLVMTKLSTPSLGSTARGHLLRKVHVKTGADCTRVGLPWHAASHPFASSRQSRTTNFRRRNATGIPEIEVVRMRAPSRLADVVSTSCRQPCCQLLSKAQAA